MTIPLKTYIMEASESESNIISGKGKKILSAFKEEYPRALTVNDLVEITGEANSTVSSYKQRLERNNFIKKIEARKRRPGRPSPGDPVADSRSEKFVIENANYLNYSKDMYKLAPGNVEYPSEFLNLCDGLLNEENENDIYGALQAVVEKILRRLTESDEEKAKRLTLFKEVHRSR